MHGMGSGGMQLPQMSMMGMMGNGGINPFNKGMLVNQINGCGGLGKVCVAHIFIYDDAKVLNLLLKALQQQHFIMPRMQANMMPGMHTSVMPGMQAGIMPGMQAGIMLGMQTSIMPGTQTGIPHKTKKLLLLQLIVTSVSYFLRSTIKWLIQQ